MPSRSSRARAWSRTASSVRPDRVHATVGAGPSSSAAGSSTGSACSMMTCALVPLMPNDDTPARRGPSQGRASVSSSMVPADQSTNGEGTSACRVRGSVPCRMAWSILMMPATPEAAWVWPMLDLTEPSRSGRSASRSWP